MSFTYYSSGERDDEDEMTYLLPEDWHTYDRVVPRERHKESIIVMPKEFDDHYYIEKRDSYPKGSREWWDWEKIRNYSHSTLALLRSSFQAFVSKYDVDITDQKIPAFLLNKVYSDMPKHAELQIKREASLAQQYNDRRNFVSNKVHKHKVVAKLQNKAMLAWGYYYACNGYYPVRDVMKLHEFNQSLGSKTDNEILNTYALCERIKYQLLKLDKSVSSSGMQYYSGGPRSEELYPNVKMIDIYNNVMASFGYQGSDMVDYTINNLKTRLDKMSKSDDLHRRVIGFYSHFVIMRRLLWRMKCINEKMEQGNKTAFAYDDIAKDIFVENVVVDMYKRSCSYYKSCDELLSMSDGLDPRLVKDIQDVTDRFATVITNANKFYRQSHFLDAGLE